MMHFQFVLDDENGLKLKDIMRKSEKDTQQEYFEDHFKEVIKNCQKKKE